MGALHEVVLGYQDFSNEIWRVDEENVGGAMPIMDKIAIIALKLDEKSKGVFLNIQ